MKEEKKKDKCSCDDSCKCESECRCNHENGCGDNCTCDHEKGECSCGGECKNEGCNCQSEDLATTYLDLAKRVQAEFENYRKRTALELERAKQEGEINIIESFLPCLDTFKIAKKSITDQKVLEGVEMIEGNILGALERVGVERIKAVGEKFDPNFHNVIALTKAEDKENDIILEEYQAGYKFKDKVIRYSKVIVNKKEE